MCLLLVVKLQWIQHVFGPDHAFRIVSQLQSCFDELDIEDGPCCVIVIGTTNRPDSLDPALRRPGRFEQEIAIGMPDRTSRMQIAKAVVSRSGT